MTSGDREHSDSASSGCRHTTHGSVRCIVLLPRGTEAPDELMSSLRARNLDICTVSSPSAVMAELGSMEIDYRHRWSAAYESASAADVADGAEPPLPERDPIILLSVEPRRIEAVLDLNAAVARFYPGVLRWCYDPLGNPRLGPMSPNEPAPLSDDDPEAKTPEIHTRPIGTIKPSPRTSASSPPPLRLHHGDEVDPPQIKSPSSTQQDVDEAAGGIPPSSGNGRTDHTAASSEREPRQGGPVKPGNPSDEAVTSEELAMLLSPDDPENNLP